MNDRSGSAVRAPRVAPDDGTSVQAAVADLVANVERVIVGKHETVTMIAVALLCEGHVLLEDVPGVGKTLLAKAVARSIGGSFRRIQFTPDLLPSDVTGINVFDQGSGSFRFRAGPVIANIVLADEINRATPRTQSCLLEAMEERQVTIDDATRALPRPFLVLATQNPIEQEGTFPLPEAQLDRFSMTLAMGYPSAAEEERIITRFERTSPLDDLAAVISGEELVTLQRHCRAVFVEPSLRGYLVRLVQATRGYASLRLGASPRAAQRLYQAAQALAAIEGRDFVTPDDIKRLAAPVLSHRLVLGAEARLRGETAADILHAVLESVPVPVD